MTLHSILHHAQAQLAQFGRRATAAALARPAVSATALLVAGITLGAGLQATQVGHLQAQATGREVQIQLTRDEAQREVNALAARLGELQAQANRLNALGDRLTRIGQLGDGEFDFNKPVGVGGAGPVRDMAAAELQIGRAHV